MLGERQLDFLDQWAGWKDGVAMKAVLSQTGFCGAAHLHGNKENTQKKPDVEMMLNRQSPNPLHAVSITPARCIGASGAP